MEAEINVFLNGKKQKKLNVNIACIVSYVRDDRKFRPFILIPNRASDVRDINLKKNKDFNNYRKNVHNVCKTTGKRHLITLLKDY